MNSTTEPVPKREGLGCFGTGCVTVVCLLIFLVVAFVGGGYWALHHLQKTYSATEPLSFGNVSSSELTIRPESSPESAADTAAAEPQPTPPPVPAPVERRESVSELQARYRAFEKAADRHQKARVELTADDINTLIENDPKLRGKAAVSVQDHTARVQVSIPLGEIFMMNGRYLNGEATVEPSPDGDPQKARVTNIILANQPVPDDIIDRRLFGWSSIRGYITDWMVDREIAYLAIQNHRVIGETRGGR